MQLLDDGMAQDLQFRSIGDTPAQPFPTKSHQVDTEFALFWHVTVNVDLESLVAFAEPDHPSPILLPSLDPLVICLDQRQQKVGDDVATPATIVDVKGVGPSGLWVVARDLKRFRESEFVGHEKTIREATRWSKPKVLRSDSLALDHPITRKSGARWGPRKNKRAGTTLAQDDADGDFENPRNPCSSAVRIAGCPTFSHKVGCSRRIAAPHVLHLFVLPFAGQKKTAKEVAK